MQIQQGKGATVKYAGPVDCAVKLVKQGGIKSLYKGTCATLLRGNYFISSQKKLIKFAKASRESNL